MILEILRKSIYFPWKNDRLMISESGSAIDGGDQLMDESLYDVRSSCFFIDDIIVYYLNYLIFAARLNEDGAICFWG